MELVQEHVMTLTLVVLKLWILHPHHWLMTIILKQLINRLCGEDLEKLISHSASQEIPCHLWNSSFIIMFTRAHS